MANQSLWSGTRTVENVAKRGRDHKNLRDTIARVVHLHSADSWLIISGFEAFQDSRDWRRLAQRAR
eukprot:scaffold42524_cov16-Prasinocladus_malaysianus.AAC.1